MPEEIRSKITGTVWKIEVSKGDEVEDGDDLMILESMKMEIPVECPCDGTVMDSHVNEGQAIKEGDLLATVEED